jgi:hypothetical protein
MVMVLGGLLRQGGAAGNFTARNVPASAVRDGAQFAALDQAIDVRAADPKIGRRFIDGVPLVQIERQGRGFALGHRPGLQLSMTRPLK